MTLKVHFQGSALSTRDKYSEESVRENKFRPSEGNPSSETTIRRMKTKSPRGIFRTRTRLKNRVLTLNEGNQSKKKASLVSDASTDYPCLKLSEKDKKIISKSLFRKSRQVEENKSLFSSDIIENTIRFEDMFVSIS